MICNTDLSDVRSDISSLHKLKEKSRTESLMTGAPMEKVGRLSSVFRVIRLEASNMNDLFIGSADDLDGSVFLYLGNDIRSTRR